MQIRDNGKPYKIYFATDAVVQFSLPGDYDATGKTFSLAVRTERNVNTPALAEATGTVSGQIVTFSVDTNTQTFLDAVQSGISTAWLEIYVGDEDVLLQRPISIEPRAGSLEGQPPAPIVLYYTAAQVDALLAGKEAAGTAQTLVTSHNDNPEAHPGTFDAAGAASAAVTVHNGDANAHPGTFDPAGTAGTAVEDHNDNPGAHQGRLLGLSPSPGGVMTGRLDMQGNPVWVEQVGDYMQTITGDFSAEPGAVYALDLSENKTIYIEAAGASDFEFALVVTMGATLRSLTLLPDMVSAILWSDGGNPPDYNAANPAPALDTTLATYTIHFRYIASENALHAELAATKDYNLPISGVRGVFTSSGGAAVSSGFVVSGGTIGNTEKVDVFSRGAATEQLIVTGGTATVHFGGVMTDTSMIGAGRITASAGGSVSKTTTGAGFVVAMSGGRCLDNTVTGGFFIVSAGGSAFDAVVKAPSGSAMLRGGALSGAVVSSAGAIHVSSGGIASDTIVSSGGNMVVSSGGAALEVTSMTGAVVTVLEGGTITYKQ